MKKLITTIILTTLIGLTFSATSYAAEERENNTAAIEANLININTATVKQLQSLPGIGEKKARAIVDYRTANGRFLSVNELLNVKGIGKKMISKISDKVGAG